MQGNQDFSVDDVIDNSESSKNIYPCFTHDYTMKYLTKDEENAFFILHFNISSLQKRCDKLL